MDCNLCGLTCDLGTEAWPANPHGLIGAGVMGGYLSTPGNGCGALDDCTGYDFSLCEFCLDWLFEQFRVPVKMQSAHVDWPGVWRPAAQRVAEDEWRTYKQEFFAEKGRRDAARKGMSAAPSCESIPFHTTPEQQVTAVRVMSYLRDLFGNDPMDPDDAAEWAMLEKAAEIAKRDQGVYDLLVILSEAEDHFDWIATLAEIESAVRDYERVSAPK